MKTSDANAVTIIDVFPRDGLQTVLHEPDLRTPTTAEKVELILALDQVGVPEIEITGFVHPKVIPSLADAEAVAHDVLQSPYRATVRALVPNYRGAERAIAAGVSKLACLVVCSETYQNLNANMTVADNLSEIERIVDLARSRSVDVCASVGVCFVCPYEGVISLDRLQTVLGRLVAMGVTEISMADSVGLAWPALIRERTSALLDRWPDLSLGLHLHTLAGLALANAYVGYQAGVRRFESSVGGIGGGIAMPIHTTSMANVATEDLVYMFESSGIHTGIDLAQLVDVARRAQTLVGTGTGHVTAFGTLDQFLAINRAHLDRLRQSPPGRSQVR